jgi:hypothetical protein
MSRSDLNWKRWVRVEDLGFILVVFVPLVAFCVFVCGQVFRTMLVNAHWIAIPLFLWPLLLPPILYAACFRSSFTAAASVLIPLEVLAAFLAQYTLIGLSSFVALLLLWANLIPVGLQFVSRARAPLASWTLLGLIALGSLLPQMRLGMSLLKLESESQRIIAYSYDYKLRTSAFPADLSGYTWRHAELRDHFAYYGNATDDKFTYPFKDSPEYDRSEKFSLRYYVGNRGTAYWYSSKKGWFIEDD